MIDEDKNVSLIDFGLAYMIGKDGWKQDDVGHNNPVHRTPDAPLTTRGSPNKAPERILDQKYSFNAETW